MKLNKRLSSFLLPHCVTPFQSALQNAPFFSGVQAVADKKRKVASINATVRSVSIAVLCWRSALVPFVPAIKDGTLNMKKITYKILNYHFFVAGMSEYLVGVNSFDRRPTGLARHALLPCRNTIKQQKALGMPWRDLGQASGRSPAGLSSAAC